MKIYTRRGDTGETALLQSVVTGETPLLFWLWSPY